MTKRIIKNGDEQDAYTGWKKYLCYLQRPGAVKKIKKRTHKRERREVAKWIAEYQEMENDYEKIYRKRL